jgi:hypothetical protein
MVPQASLFFGRIEPTDGNASAGCVCRERHWDLCGVVFASRDTRAQKHHTRQRRSAAIAALVRTAIATECTPFTLLPPELRIYVFRFR